MTHLKTLIFTLALSFLATSFIQAQGYNSAVGLRLGVPASVSYKMFINDSGHALEGYVSFRSQKSFGARYSWIGVNAAYQVHNEISSVDGLYWYYGGGASAFFWNFDNDFIGGSDQSSVSFGLQGYLGLDYKLANTPVNFSADWVPTFFLNGYGNGFGGGYGAFAVRYTID